MEIPETIINKAWIAKKTTPADTGLIKILNKLATLTVKKFIDTKSKTPQDGDMKIRVLYSGWMSKPESEKIKKLQGYSSAMQNCLDAAFQDTSLTSLLSFLMAQTYFSVPFPKFLDDGNYSKDRKDALGKQLEVLLQSLKLDFNVLKNTSYYEQSMLNTAIKAEAEGDILDFYRLINSIERSTGLLFNPLVSKLSLFYWYLNAPGFASFITTIKKPLNVIFYLHEFSKEELVSLSPNTNYAYWLNFEIARRINFFCQSKYSTIEQEAIKYQLLNIYNNEKELFKKAIRYFSGSELAMCAFGNVTQNLPDSFIISVFKDCFTLNEYTNRIIIHEKFLGELIKSLALTDLKKVLEAIYNTWNDFTTKLLLKEDFYQSSPLLTDFAPYVSAHYQYNISDQEITNRINEKIDAITNLESEWFISKSKAITKYSWLGSQLFIYAVAFINKGLADSNIKSGVERLIKNDLQVPRYRTSNELALEYAWKIIKDNT